jgi:hypothetical protein
MGDTRLEDALRHLQPPPGVQLWHGGATVLGCLRGVSARTARWIPSPGRNSIWSLTLHISYWKYAVSRRLVDGPRGAFPRRPSNWPAIPEPADEAAWKADRSLLRESHHRVIDAVRSFDATRLDQPAGDSSMTYADLIWGIVLHDVYHVGQIQLLKKLHATKK